MKKLVTICAVAVTILAISSSAQALISGIGTPSSSFASINFDDTTSLNPSAVPGITNVTVGGSPWNGSSLTLFSTIDSVTLDEAKGNLLGQIINPTTYDVSLNSVRLTQAAGNTGYAHLLLRFSIEFQLDSFGLGSQATLFPTFTVNGTVQPGGTGFAQFGGTIDYYGMNTAYQSYLLDTVTYAPPAWTTPGPFNGTVAGVPTVGTTPTLPGTFGPNISTLTLIGNFDFMVDPATINIETVPEPATMCLLGLGGLLLRRKRSKT
ncbi:MAG: PEP-CTERM sorting domain-containing protein [Sedimentisphaerales bacterium]|jgi:hypothetical protein